jgi:cation transport ATPase
MTGAAPSTPPQNAKEVEAVTEAVRTTLVGILLLSGSVWIGGWVALITVAVSSTGTLPPPQRVAFFRKLGRIYGTVSTTALVMALVTGGILLWSMPWHPLSMWIVALAAVLVVVLAAGVVQARALTRARSAAHQEPEDAALAARIRRTAVAAGVLRASIGLISMAIGVLGLLLAS